MAVCGGPDQAREPIGKLQNIGIKGQFLPAPGGFTELIIEHQAGQFLGRVDELGDVVLIEASVV